MVVVRVSDNGMGIPEDRLKDVFNMFTQIEAHSTHTKGGLGIGLTLVSKLVALHHGSVSVNSQGPGKGSTFTVKLPMSELAYDKHDNIDEGQSSSSGKRILFVDDNEDLIDMYCLLATSMRYQALGITSPRKAIEEFKSFKPHCVFLDIGMPDIDGYELCKILKASPEASSVRFYSQSGWGTDKYIERSRQAGFDSHFVKPLSKETIKKVMD